MVKLFKPTSYRSAAALAVGATALWKGISFINALLLAAYFGASRATDVYFYLILTMGVGWFFVQRLNAAVIIPHAMTLESTKPNSGRALLNGYLYMYIVLAALLIGLGICAPVQSVSLFSRFSAPYLETQRTLIAWAFVFFALQILTTYLLAILEMYKRFATALFTPLNALMPLLFLLCFGRTHGVISMLYGFVVSYAVQVLIYSVMLKKELGWKLTRGEIYHSAAFAKNLVSNQCMELANIVSGVLPLYLLSGLGTGVVSALNYARQLSDSSTEVFTLRVTNVSKIQLTELAAQNNWPAFNNAYNTTHFALWFLLTPLSVFSIFYAPEIITLFFARGEFSTQDVRESAAFLRPLLGLVWIMVPILMQSNIVAATRKLKEFFPYALAGILLFIVSVPFTVDAWGALAYPYTQLVCCVAGQFINWMFLRKYLPDFYIKPAFTDGLRLVGFNLISLIPAVLCTRFLAGQTAWMVLLVGGLIYVAVLAALTYYSSDFKRFLQVASSHNPS